MQDMLLCKGARSEYNAHLAHVGLETRELTVDNSVMLLLVSLQLDRLNLWLQIQETCRSQAQHEGKSQRAAAIKPSINVRFLAR